MVLFTRILHRTRVPHATSKSVLNTALSSHPLPRYAHPLAVTCYVSGRLHATNRYGVHTASPTGTHAREARAPRRVLTCTRMYMFHDMSRTLICVYIYRLPRTHPLRRRLRRRPGYIRTCRCANLIYALAYVYACNGPSRGPGSLRESRRLPTGVTTTRTASPHGGHNAGRTRSAAASVVGPILHILTSIHASTYSLDICVCYITAPHGSPGDSREPRRLLTGVSATHKSSPHGRHDTGRTRSAAALRRRSAISVPSLVH